MLFLNLNPAFVTKNPIRLNMNIVVVMIDCCDYYDNNDVTIYDKFIPIFPIDIS
jgi:hypothetical protein